MSDGALPLHRDALPAATQVQVVTILEHISFPTILPLFHLFFLASVVVDQRLTTTSIVDPAVTGIWLGITC